jgi:DNA polymerase-1
MLFEDSISKTCEKCKKYQKTQSSFIEPIGKGKKKVLIVGPPAGNKETDTFQEFDDILWENGIDLLKDCWYVPCVQCHLGSLKATDSVISNCSCRIEDNIYTLKPKIIVCCGTSAIKSVCASFTSLGTFAEGSLNGTKAPLLDYNAWCFFTMDFSKILNRKQTPNVASEFKRDLKKLTDLIKKPVKLPEFNPYEKTFLLHKYDQIMDALDDIYEKAEVIAFDYETTALKPHKEDSKITVAAICADGFTYAFPVRYACHFSEEESLDIEDAIADILSCKEIFKIAQNAVFEWNWSFFKFEKMPEIDYCTQIGQHLLDPRSKVTGLKHQAFVRFGVCGYEDFSKKYIKSESSSGYGLNKMDEMPLIDQLTYCAADARITYHIYFEQKKETPEKMQFLFDTYMEGMKWFAKMSINGFPINEKYYKKTQEKLHKEMQEIIQTLNESQEAISFVNKYDSEINWNSGKDLKKFYFEHLKLKPFKTTASGAASTDEEALLKLGHWTGELLLKYRKKQKLADTYISQFQREACKNKVHPAFSLSVALSGRPSCYNPNLLNIPKRNKEQKEAIRKGMRPSKGHRLGEIDFSGIEVSTSACYHQDTNFIHYLQNEDADMHRDNGADIWKLSPDEVTKEIRFYAKNKWTFPQFYGDWYGSCGEVLWEECLDLETVSGTLLREHIKKQGIGTKQKFLQHLKSVEEKMWKERFPEYDKWKTTINQEYIKKGEIFSFVGFRYKGLLDKKQTTNLPIQGTAFFVLMWCGTKIQKWLEKKKYKTKIVCQVYDSLVFDFHPDEVVSVLKKTKEVCEKQAIKTFKWITVPYKIDIELSEVDGNFNEMSEYEIKNNKLLKKG